MGQSSDENFRSSDAIASSIPENGSVSGVEDCVANVNEDSPYSRNIVSVEDRPSNGNEDLDSLAPPFASTTASRGEHRWSDTSSYAAKKVPLFV